MNKRYKCSPCDYLWISKKNIGEPACCPKCRSDDIYKVRFCKNCKEEFLDDDPIFICQNYSWFLGTHGIPICKKCSWKCNSCDKTFCPNHSSNHKCR